MRCPLIFCFPLAAGYTDPRHPQYELSFDQFLDAVAAVAVARFPLMDPTQAAQELLRLYLRPLFILRFREEPPTSDGGHDGDDNGTVVTSRTNGTTSKMSTRRKSRVVLTGDGITSAAAAASSAGPRVPIIVDQTTEVALHAGATAMSPQPGASGRASVVGDPTGGQPATVRRRMTTRLAGAGGGGFPSAAGGSAPVHAPQQRSRSADPRKSTATVSSTVNFLTPVAHLPPAARGGAAAGAGAGGGGGLPSARGAVPSIFSVNPFSPEARAPVGSAATSPASAAAPRASPGAAGSPAANVELRGMVSRLVAVVDQLRGEVQRLRDENTELRAQVHILKGGSPLGSGR